MCIRKSALLLLFCTVFLLPTLAQKPVLLPTTIANADEEYSALATAGNRLLLIPQYPVTHKTYALPVKTAGKKITRHKPLQETDFTEITIQHLPAIVARINRNGNYYQGIEGAVAVGNTLFLSVETDEATDSCYLIKGYLQQNTLYLDITHITALPKVTCQNKIVNNAGYESLTYDAVSNKLLAVFEYTNVTDIAATPVGYLADTALNNTIPPSPVFINQAIPFRLTDLCAGSNGAFYGINFWWAGEYDDYFACTPQTPIPVKDSALFRNSAHKLTCYGRILQLQLKEQQLSWQPLQDIGYDCYNWEGIAPLKGRLLVITDANKGKYLEKTTHVIITDPLKH